MNTVRDWIPTAEDTYMTIEEWEECVVAGVFIDYDGFGYFCNPETKTELYGFDVCPSDLIEQRPAYFQRKAEWTHINWFNR